jgi:hypothetical protein
MMPSMFVSRCGYPAQPRATHQLKLIHLVPTNTNWLCESLQKYSFQDARTVALTKTRRSSRRNMSRGGPRIAVFLQCNLHLAFNFGAAMRAGVNHPFRPRGKLDDVCLRGVLLHHGALAGRANNFRGAEANKVHRNATRSGKRPRLCGWPHRGLWHAVVDWS